ncbi:unnamed protein product [Heligmosomoides polygyrus]|uniref:Rieske domain-containing protein n=1 Tax=Heligmosomoides polygyrus TaxID=6339 RepID=A0A3P8BSU1_HELPZ|nr:unnamed protein product [Heligmosomoides polygyrus]
MANKRLIGGATTKVAPGGGRGGEEESLLFATSDRLTVFGGQDGLEMVSCTAIDDDSPSIVNEVIGRASEVPPGEKKVFTVREKKILVINDNGTLYATGGICSHYNYSLENGKLFGIYSKGRIRCPLHGACFNVKTGDMEDYPGFDSIPTFDVTEKDGDLILNTTEKNLENARRTRKSAVRSVCDDHPIIVVGGGISAATFVESARLNNCPTPITMITEEEFPSYDRVLLSKVSLTRVRNLLVRVVTPIISERKPVAEGKDIRLRSDEYYKENHIDVLTKTRVSKSVQTHPQPACISREGAAVIGVDIAHRRISLSNGDCLPYSKLVLALGGAPRRLTVPGADLKNVFTLRTVSEANSIAAASVGQRVVCIGGSFIGMEIASALAATAASVTVVCATKEPLPALGTDIGEVIRKRFEAKGVKILTNALAERLEGVSEVSGVTLKSGETIQADVVIAGIGVEPPTAWLKDTCIELDGRGFIKVDKHFRTTADWIFAIGDAVAAPLPLWNIDSINIQHFQTAQAHGQMLGYSIVGRPYPRDIVPFFWTLFFFEFGIRFAGCSHEADETVVHGSLDDLNFTKYYLKDGVVVAVASAGPVPIAIQFLELFQRKIVISRKDIEK